MKIDWQKLAINIRSSMSLVKASESIGRHRDWLNHLARGDIEEPKFSDGLALLNIHLDLCGIEKHRKLINLDE